MPFARTVIVIFRCMISLAPYLLNPLCFVPKYVFRNVWHPWENWMLTLDYKWQLARCLNLYICPLFHLHLWCYSFLLANRWLLSWTFYIYKKFNHSEIKSDQLFLLLFQDTITNFRLWKIFPSVFAFQSTPELMFGLYLLYYFRVFERQIGSNKYSVGTLPFIFLPSILMKWKNSPLKENLINNTNNLL